MSDRHPAIPEILAKAIHALGGTWGTQRAVTALRDAGIEAASDRARDKQARDALRRLHKEGVLDRFEGPGNTVEYRLKGI